MHGAYPWIAIALLVFVLVGAIALVVRIALKRFFGDEPLEAFISLISVILNPFVASHSLGSPAAWPSELIVPRDRRGRGWRISVLAMQAAGSLVWNPPKRMRVAELRRVEVRLSDGTVSTNELIESLKQQASHLIGNLEVAPRLRVQLMADPKDFGIRARNSEDQLLRPGSIGRWDFDITAKRHGTRQLRLLVSIRTTVDGKDEIVDLPSYDHEISVSVSPVRSVGRFLVDNWKWLAATIAVPLAGWFLVASGLSGGLGKEAQRLFGTVPPAEEKPANKSSEKTG